MRLRISLIVICFAAIPVYSAESRKPVIDMHMHATRASFATGVLNRVAEYRDVTEWSVLDTVKAATSDEQVLEGTLNAMRRYRIVRAVTSGELLDRFQDAASDRIIPSLQLTQDDLKPDKVRELLSSGRYKVLGEITTQYGGIAPNDPRLDPIFAIAESLDIPVGIHMGMGGGSPAFRVSAGNPLLLEEVLARHPRLRIYVMHAGYPMLGEMIAMMQVHRRLHVDIAEINWVRPPASFHSYLRGLVEAGLSKRIMFGSDQLVWPESFTIAIEAIEKADYLTEQQKRDILCFNAARFLRLEQGLCE